MRQHQRPRKKKKRTKKRKMKRRKMKELEERMTKRTRKKRKRRVKRTRQRWRKKPTTTRAIAAGLRQEQRPMRVPHLRGAFSESSRLPGES